MGLRINPQRIKLKLLRAWWYSLSIPKRCAMAVPWLLTIIEGIVSFVPFFLSWMGCAIYYAVKMGHAISTMKADEKRVALRELLFGKPPS